MKKIVLAVILTVLAATGAYALGTDNFKEEVEKEALAVKLAREVVKGGYGIVTTEELQGIQKAGEDVLLIDTMPFEASYKKGHIPKAKQFAFPIADMNDWDSKETEGKSLEDFQKLLGADKGKKIIFYCGFVKCTRSHNGAVWAKKLGYTNVYRHPGGIFAWRGAEYQVETGE
ncbi:MAG: rhodanese-like domain-containing protein [Desulforhopalus sp.]|nr:rhodanese-like domain-containing protein [Desulforhopalus sp.]